jgi:hypothetical protein
MAAPARVDYEQAPPTLRRAITAAILKIQSTLPGRAVRAGKQFQQADYYHLNKWYPQLRPTQSGWPKEPSQ